MTSEHPEFNLPLLAGASHSVMGRSGLAATLAVTGAVFVTALVSQPELLNGGQWIPFLVVVLIFALLVNRTAPTAERSLLSVGLLMAQAVVALALIPLSARYFLTPLLTFVTVSQSQFMLPQHWANVFDLALLIGIAAVFGLTSNWSAGLQSGLGYAAGYLFIIAFTHLAQRERTARESLEQAHRQLGEYAAQVERLATAAGRYGLMDYDLFTRWSPKSWQIDDFKGDPQETLY